MTVADTAKQIVREYFSNAIIIDDELEIMELFEMKALDVESSILEDQIDYSEIDEELIDKNEIAVASENIEIQLLDISHTPNDLYRSFIDTGILTMPFKYDRDEEARENIKKIEKVLRNSQILIVDWEMEGNTGVITPGDASKQIIKTFLSQDAGIKCSVIYTKGDLGLVLNSIGEENEFEIIDEGSYFFQTKEGVPGSSLFGFVMNKKVSPDEIIEKISDILIKDKSTTLHFMECVNKLDKNMHKTLQKFDNPFEKVLFSQIFTSDIPNNEITSFINNTLLSDLMDEYSQETDTHFLFERKKEKIRNVIHGESIPEDFIKDLIDLLNIKKGSSLIIDQFKKQDIYTELNELLIDPQTISFESFREGIEKICRKYTEKKDISQIVNDFLLFILLIENYINEAENCTNQKLAFKESFFRETVMFTKMLKYYSHSSKIQTGTILRDALCGKYYLCITPVCDIARLEDVDNKYKFIVGTLNESGTDLTNILKNSSNKSHCSSIPDANNNVLSFITWKFYDVETKDKETVENRMLEKSLEIVGNMKIDYAQNIINKYIAYQSRAGINEMFFKETNYIPNFLNIISQ